MARCARSRMPVSVKNPTDYVFVSAEEAIMWSADVLRSRRRVRLASLWRQVLAEGENLTTEPLDARAVAAQADRRNRLPSEATDRLDLALRVEQVLEHLSPDDALLLRRYAWGDWASDASLRLALSHQEVLHKKGGRLLLNYRWTFRQIAVFYDCDEKTAARRVRKALLHCARIMDEAGLLLRVKA